MTFLDFYNGLKKDACRSNISGKQQSLVSTYREIEKNKSEGNHMFEAYYTAEAERFKAEILASTIELKALERNG